MKLRETRFRSVEKRNPVLKGMEILLYVCTAVMWLTRDGLGLGTGDMLVMTGFTVFVASMSLINGSFRRRNRKGDGHIDRLRDEIGTEDYKSAGMFFKDK